MKDKELVSVIVPVYNTAQYLPRCIDSILGQSWKNIELILVDDGSTDDSGRICRSYSDADGRIRVISKENGGVCSARNRGLREMQGDYFLFLDSDDALEPNIITEALEALACNPGADMAVFGWKKLFQSGNTDSYLPEECLVSDMDAAVKTLLTNYNGYGGGYPNKLWRTASFGGKIPEYDESLYYFEDLEWMTRMFLGIRKFVCLPRNGYLYYIREDSTTFRSDNAERKEKGYHLSALQIIQDLALRPSLNQWFRDRYCPEIVNGVLHAWKQGHRALSKWLLVQMKEHARDIFTSETIPVKIKVRCAVLMLLGWVQ